LPDTHKALLQRTGHVVLERYGMTETNMNTSNPCDGERRPGTVGLPPPGTALRVADPQTGRLLHSDEIGIIEIRGPPLFAGYWRLPEETQEEFRPDSFFVTSDLGKVDSHGYVHIVGRAEDLITSGGFSLKRSRPRSTGCPASSSQLSLACHILIFGEGVMAIAVKQAEAALSEDAIRDCVAERLAKFKLPKRVLFAEQLPRNGRGKVQKNLLRDAYLDHDTPRAVATRD